MAMGVLQLARQFGHRRAERGDEQQRVVAEAAAAARRVEDLAPPAAAGHQRLRIAGTSWTSPPKVMTAAISTCAAKNRLPLASPATNPLISGLLFQAAKSPESDEG